MKNALLSVLVLTTFGSSGVLAAAKDVVFHAPKDKVYAAALEVIATEYRVEQANKESGMISFRSGASMSSFKGQDLSLVLIEVEGGCKVVVNSEKRDKAFSWGEGGKLQKKVLHLIGKKLAEQGAIPESEIPKK